MFAFIGPPSTLPWLVMVAATEVIGGLMLVAVVELTADERALLLQDHLMLLLLLLILVVLVGIPMGGGGFAGVSASDADGPG